MKKYEESILEMIEKQIAFEKPPFVSNAYQELLKKGIKEADAKGILANVLSQMIYDLLNEQRQYSEEEYKRKIEEITQSI